MVEGLYLLSAVLLGIVNQGAIVSGRDRFLQPPPGVFHNAYSLFSIVGNLGSVVWLVLGFIWFPWGVPVTGALLAIFLAGFIVGRVPPVFGATFVIYGTPLAVLFVLATLVVR